MKIFLTWLLIMLIAVSGAAALFIWQSKGLVILSLLVIFCAVIIWQSAKRVDKDE